MTFVEIVMLLAGILDILHFVIGMFKDFNDMTKKKK